MDATQLWGRLQYLRRAERACIDASKRRAGAARARAEHTRLYLPVAVP